MLVNQKEMLKLLKWPSKATYCKLLIVFSMFVISTFTEGSNSLRIFSISDLCTSEKNILEID